MRTFDSGATRDDDKEKIDPEGYLSPLALEAYFNYMRKHQKCADGSVRASDDWLRGIPITVYMKSAWRHFFAVWRGHRAGKIDLDDLCALMFNVQGLLHERVKQDKKQLPEEKDTFRQEYGDQPKTYNGMKEGDTVLYGGEKVTLVRIRPTHSPHGGKYVSADEGCEIRYPDGWLTWACIHKIQPVVKKSSFRYARPNDRVWSSIHGWGKILEVNEREGKIYPVLASFPAVPGTVVAGKAHLIRHFTLDGRRNIVDRYPMLFWEKPS